MLQGECSVYCTLGMSLTYTLLPPLVAACVYRFSILSGCYSDVCMSTSITVAHITPIIIIITITIMYLAAYNIMHSAAIYYVRIWLLILCIRLLI